MPSPSLSEEEEPKICRLVWLCPNMFTFCSVPQTASQDIEKLENLDAAILRNISCAVLKALLYKYILLTTLANLIMRSLAN